MNIPAGHIAVSTLPAGGVRAKKSLGQHFLHDPAIAQRIVASLSGNAGTALEVGPGRGVLTALLLQRTDIITYAAEIDQELIAFLRTRFPAWGERLMAGDFLTLPLHEYFQTPFAVIGNFPYNISSQIFFKILENRRLIPEVVGMIQKEVAERIACRAGGKTYGILSVLLQAYYRIEYLFTVHEHAFTPPPKVKSAVIRLTRNAVTQLDCDEQLFIKVVKATFNQRRKVIRNSIKALTGAHPLPEHRYFSMRPEQLGVDEFVELTQIIEHFPCTEEK
ncbi:MAG: 16S rRNA (adenine(1518)-N(6)/adenine(1519)-N(6))-dimethyltransferase RsmA [Prevotellaceae bacterium]|jgi:16S rRNA (adenine1518-N6/adenine1519-N6)-dimethyltransferase|nr:16S rRNA (adenine(1518)-N(6)/adenine(1519)-N(6))-dimethyltransferase RsmA [Prevotellaceae bacterium]